MRRLVEAVGRRWGGGEEAASGLQPSPGIVPGEEGHGHEPCFLYLNIIVFNHIFDKKTCYVLVLFSKYL